MRVLGRIRLSRLTEESTSAARQRELIEQWASGQGHEIVGWAEDLDISGSVDPFDTPSLGGWLERHPEWDILCAWKLDRYGRNSIKLNKLFGWCIDHQKTLVSCSEGIDLSTPVGRLIANVIAFLAEGELEAIRERTKASRRKLVESGRWPGGQVPYGFLPKQLPDGGWKLVHHPEQSVILRKAVSEVTDGASVDAVSDRYGINKSTLWKILTARYLMGHATYEGSTVRDDQGMPVYVADPILTEDEFAQLQAALDARRTGPMRTKDTSPLYGVLKCYECGKNLYHRTYKQRKHYRYYHCVDKHAGFVDAVLVEEMLEETFLERVGDEFIMEKVFVPAENHQIELEAARRAVDELASLYGTMTSDAVRSRLTEQMRALDFRIGQLETLPSREAGYEYKNTGLTFKSVWTNSNQEERRQLLITSGITYRVKRIPGTETYYSDIYIPEEMLDRLNAKKPPRVP